MKRVLKGEVTGNGGMGGWGVKARDKGTEAPFNYFSLLTFHQHYSLNLIPSMARSFLFISIPIEKPPMVPSFLVTLWQGIMMGMGFRFTACPAALCARG